MRGLILSQNSVYTIKLRDEFSVSRENEKFSARFSRLMCKNSFSIFYASKYCRRNIVSQMSLVYHSGELFSQSRHRTYAKSILSCLCICYCEIFLSQISVHKTNWERNIFMNTMRENLLRINTHIVCIYNSL